MTRSFAQRTIFLAALAVLAGPGAFAGDQAVILWAEGDVQVELPTTPDTRAVQVNETLPEGSRLTTGTDSAVGLGFEGAFSDSSVALGSNGIARLTALGDQPEVNVDQGTAFTKLLRVRKGSQFKLSTPTAVASARGTGWKQSDDSIEVFEGNVDLVSSSGQKVALSPGDAYQLNPNGSLGAKTGASAEARQSWAAYYTSSFNSPFFGRIRAADVLDIRSAIDAKRQSEACGSLAPYPWKDTPAEGGLITADQINELKSALSGAPFAQSAGYVAAYLAPLRPQQSGDPIRGADLYRLLDAAENASC